MRTSETSALFPRPIFLLSLLTALLAAAASAAGLFWDSPGEPTPFQTAHGETITLYGRGLYRLDWAFRVPIQRGTDAVILFVLIPALLLALLYAQRGSRRARLLLAGLLVGFLYNAASTAFGVAFNPLFPLYVAYFSASLFAFVGLFATLAKESHADPHLLGTNIPRLGIAIFLGLSALSTLVWLFEIAPALAQGGAPATLAHYTTEVTALLDWGVVAPACLLAAVWLLRRHPLGVPLAAVMLVFMVLVGGIVFAQRLAQALAGEAVSAAETAAYVAPFILLSGVAFWLGLRLFRAIKER